MADDCILTGLWRNQLLGARITQQFGNIFAGEPTTFGIPNFHRGIDIVLPPNRTIPCMPRGFLNQKPVVRSGLGGQVIYSGWIGAGGVGSRTGTGWTAKVKGANGYIYTVGHLLDRPLVEAGQTVEAGAPLGYQGSSGYSTGDHVHIELTRPNGDPINPGRSGNELLWFLGHALGYGSHVPGASADSFATWQVPTGPGGWTWITNNAPIDPNPGGTNGGTGTGTGANGIPCGQPGSNCVGTKSDTTCTGFMLQIPNPVSGVTMGVCIPSPVPYFQRDFIPVASVAAVGVILTLAGLRKLLQEKPVQVITQPFADAGNAIKGGAQKVGQAAATVAAPEAAAVAKVVKAPIPQAEASQLAKEARQPHKALRAGASTSAPIISGAKK